MSETIPFEQENSQLTEVRKEISRVVVGQQDLVDRLLVCLLCNGHVLIEGVPGLAKTLTVSTMAQTLGVDFSRIQFTPDLLPGDLIGTLIYNQQSGEFTPHKGPVFANIVLADEINRSPAKVQSALLEAMQEKQVTIGTDSYRLDEPFLVLATQNPIEQEGTYPLPEAQLDRFMMKVLVDYPSLEEEHAIMSRMSVNQPTLEVQKVMESADILSMRASLDQIHTSEVLEHYVIKIVDATRHPETYGLSELKPLINHGVSPRASIFLLKGAKAHAMLEGRDYVIPEDVKWIAMDVLRHRISITYKAEAEGKNVESILSKILSSVETVTET
ncbi:MoxR family ATPase [Verrucomicrobiaceae bacterium N1E253]|uniref:MoxR family ATPase n=1 Tax=Oceaniferula marina TaxID=2748318 RepID=A0A851GHW0_9BACT|nr:MoxR family ATPase [Oceaniferula marina]NWK54210.1 MoxR family ATPase [Oceaniferula marina]